MDLHEMILLLFVISYKTDVSNLTMIPQNHLFVVCNLLVIATIENFLRRICCFKAV